MNEAQQSAMDRAGELPLERRAAERRAEPPAVVAEMAATIVALKEQLEQCDKEHCNTIDLRDEYHDWADKLADAIAKHFGAEIGEHSSANNPWAEALLAIDAADALASQPAAPVQQINGEFEELRKLAMAALEHGDAIGEDDWYSCDENMSIFAPNPDLSLIAATNPATILRLIALAAPPVQQPGDVRDHSLPTDISAQLREFAGNPGYSHSDYADVMRRAADECERFYGGMMAWKKTAQKKDADWNAERMERVNDRIAARQALATTRTSAALTDEQIIEIARPTFGWAAGCGGFDVAVLEFVKNFLAASSGALAVPDGWQPIETAPEVKGECLFCQIAWGPEGDQSVGDGMRWRGRWFAAGTFYNLGQERSCEFREIEVKPTHWMRGPAAPAIPAQGQTK